MDLSSRGIMRFVEREVGWSRISSFSRISMRVELGVRIPLHDFSFSGKMRASFSFRTERFIKLWNSCLKDPKS